MTHGEVWFKRKQKADLGIEPERSIKERPLPKPMSRKDAAKYYNTRLFAYWIDYLDDRLSIHRKREIISALMFGHTKNYKNLVELNYGK
ncbi:MAG: hypothetical protein JKY28_05290 [Sulfurimonas sp.]|nr:hypothetical protein [Sulfurimonas sp.]PHQ88494.1 MAG: hypothetical protein COB42_08715 [Sulfurimonas sp.]PHQ90090.1 MAG: hypothetical protein COB42_05595 [Sulfurimonas sp.]